MVTELWSGLGRLVAEVANVFRNWGLSHHRLTRRGHTAMVAI